MCRVTVVFGETVTDMLLMNHTRFHGRRHSRRRRCRRRCGGRRFTICRYCIISTVITLKYISVPLVDPIWVTIHDLHRTQIQRIPH